MIILRNIIYILFDFLFVYAVHIFMTSFFANKISPLKTIAAYICYITADCLIYFYISNSFIFMTSGLLFYFLLSLVYARFSKKNIISAVFILLFSICSELLAAGIVSVIGLLGVSVSTNMSIIATITISRLSFFLIILIAMRFIKYQKNGTNIKHYGIQIYITPVFSLWLVYYIFSLLDFNQFSLISRENILLITSMIMIITINVLSFYMFDRQYRLFSLENSNAVLKNTIDMQLHQFAVESDIRNSFHQERHNLKNYIIGIASDIRAGNDELAMTKLDEYAGSLGFSSYCKTGCLPIDSVINVKYESALAKDIKIVCDTKFKYIPVVNSEDICILIGNALDNAIEYLSNHRELPQEIDVIITCLSKVLCIDISNHIAAPVQIIDECKINSTKTEDGHGYGLSSARYITEKYDGHMILRCENDIFHFGAYLNVNAATNCQN